MRILLLAHAFNSLTQRVHAELVEAGHDVSVEFDIADSVTEEAVALWRPDLVVAPFLKRRIPDSVWRAHRCIVLHPGIVGDRGPSALDWAIMEGETRWGATALLANGELDAGDVYASVGFPMREATKGSLYRNEVTEAAVAALHEALAMIARGQPPRAVDPADPAVRGRARPLLRQIRPGDRLGRRRHGDGPAQGPRRRRLPRCRRRDAGNAGAPVRRASGRRAAGGLCRCAPRRGHRPPRRRAAARDPRRRGLDHPGRSARTTRRRAFKLPAAMALADRLDGVPEAPLAPEAVVDHPTWRPIVYEEEGDVGFLHFAFHNGAMSTEHCEALRAALVVAKARPIRVLVLLGGPDFWSNGIHLNLIEAAAHPAEESWRNINAMNDLVREIVLTSRQITIAAHAGQRRRRRRVHGAGRGPGVRARRGDPQPALQGHGQPVRLRVLDLPDAPADRRRGGARADAGAPAAARRGPPRARDSSTTASAPPRPHSSRRSPGGHRRWPPIPASNRCCGTRRAAAPPTRRSSRWNATGPRNSSACGGTSSASIRAITSRAPISSARCRARARRSTSRGIARSGPGRRNGPAARRPTRARDG